MHYDFNKDVLDGEAGEHEFVEMLTRKLSGNPKFTKINASIREKYDWEAVWPDGNRVTFEFKNDIKSAETGNVAIETWSRGKDSGLNITTADYFGIKVGTAGLYIIPVSRLRMMIVAGLQVRKVVGGDRGSNTEMVLFSVRDIEEQAFRIDNRQDGKVRVRSWSSRLSALRERTRKYPVLTRKYPVL